MGGGKGGEGVRLLGKEEMVRRGLSYFEASQPKG